MAGFERAYEGRSLASLPQELVDAIAEGVMALTPDARVLKLNRAAEVATRTAKKSATKKSVTRSPAAARTRRRRR